MVQRTDFLTSFQSISIYFDSRTRAGCDIWIAKIIAFARFRFAHPRRVRLSSQSPKLCAGYFDSRTRAGCDMAGISAAAPLSNFDSRTRVRCDTPVCFFDVRGRISIRAPVQGATHRTQSERKPRGVLIRAPVQGATGEYCIAGEHACNFDSRTRAGCDPNHPRLTRALLVSIRAPAKSATFSGKAGVIAGSIFRFVHLWEVRHCC